MGRAKNIGHLIQHQRNQKKKAEEEKLKEWACKWQPRVEEMIRKRKEHGSRSRRWDQELERREVAAAKKEMEIDRRWDELRAQEDVVVSVGADCAKAFEEARKRLDQIHIHERGLWEREAAVESAIAARPSH